MKQPLLYSAVLLLCADLNAQITIVSTDMPVIGDVLTRYVDTIPSAGQGSAGAAQTWDFSGASPDQTQVNYVVDPSTTPFAASFPGSNLAMTNDSATFLYFNNGPSMMTLDGTGGDPGIGIVITAVFTPPLTYNQFPRQYGNSFSDTYGFETIADGSAFGVYQVRVRHHGTVIDSTDGYGSITTPIGTYDCLRVKNTSYSVDSIWTKIIAILPWTFILTTSDTSTSYSWLAKETKLSVAELTLDSVGGPASFTYSDIQPFSTGIGSVASTDAGLSLYPQPALDKVCVRASDSREDAITSVTITDMDGRLVKRFPKLPADGWLDLSGIPAGVFLLRTESLDGISHTARLVRVGQ